ncbi:MAG: riboflavin synthase [Halorientalis sp.]
MFTGIVETTGRVVDVDETEEGKRLRIRADVSDLYHGQSISISGVCLTVESFGVDEREDADDRTWFDVFLSAETVAKTYLGDATPGDVVNVECAMPADGRFDGHLVQGHVDTTTEVTAVERVGEDWYFEFALPEDFEHYVVAKGSIALDGISLTVAERGDDAFGVAIIPTTYDLTTLSEKSVGDPVHVEVDVIAKYVEQMVSGYAELVGERSSD